MTFPVVVIKITAKVEIPFGYGNVTAVARIIGISLIAN